MKIKMMFGLVVLALGIVSCSNLGSVVLPPDRLAYNRSLLNSDEQQVLLNIVRLRYTDSPFFLSVNNVVSQFSFGSNYSLGVSNSAGPPALMGTGNASYSLSEAPTITYTPLQGEDFITRLFTPVDLRVMYMLFRSGWSIHHVSRLVVERYGQVENAALASRAVSGRIPEYKRFISLMSLIRRLQDSNNILISNDKIDNVFAIKITIKHFNKLSERERSILAKIGVNAQSPIFWLVSVAPTAKNQLYTETRTVIGMLNYMAKSVDVPECDIVKKLVRMTHYPNGKLFDWHNVTNGVIHIRSSKEKPMNAYVAVPYRGYWFYVADTDFISKESFNLLGIIMGIYQTKVQSVLPVFTVS